MQITMMSYLITESPIWLRQGIIVLCLFMFSCGPKPEELRKAQSEQPPRSHLPISEIVNQEKLFPAYKGLSGPVFLDISVEVDSRKHVQISGKTNLPPGVELLCSVVEKRPDEQFGPGDRIKVQTNCAFRTRWISSGDEPFSDGRYIAEVLMPVHSVQPKEVQIYFGDSGSLLTGPLVEEIKSVGKVVRSFKEFIIGKPDDRRTAMEVTKEKNLIMKWVMQVTEFEETLRNFPSLTSFKQNSQRVEELEAEFRKDSDTIRQNHFKIAITSVLTDLRVMAQASDNAEFNLQLK